MKQERVLYGDCSVLLVICGMIFAVINKKTVKINYSFLKSVFKVKIQGDDKLHCGLLL
jgi:uncharacterized integral membrane protein